MASTSSASTSSVPIVDDTTASVFDEYVEKEKRLKKQLKNVRDILRPIRKHVKKRMKEENIMECQIGKTHMKRTRKSTFRASKRIILGTADLPDEIKPIVMQLCQKEVDAFKEV